jgi:integrase
MAIKEYYVNSKKLFEIYVNLRSKVDPTIRFQKRVRGIETIRAAKSEEKKQTRILLHSIHKKEGKGLTWGQILFRYELYHRDRNFAELKKSVLDDYLGMVRKWTKDWNSIHVDELTRHEGRQLFNTMSDDGRAISYQLKMKRLINSIYDWAIEHNFIQKNSMSPVKEIKFKRPEEKMPKILTLKEVRGVLTDAKKLNHPWYPIWVMALNTGMRSGELYALTWKSIDIEGGIIFVHRNYVSKERVIGPTKGRYWRTVPISSDLKEFLVRYRSESNSGHWCDKLGEGNFVFPRFKSWATGHQASEINTFCALAGYEKIGFHTLRSCFATHLLNLSVPSAKVMKICGWKELKTMERYIRLAGIDVKGVTEELKFIPTAEILIDDDSNLLDFKSLQL